jgi:hypothetical protein
MTADEADSAQVELSVEFERQVDTLLRKAYPQAAGMSEAEFLRQIEPLRARAAELEDAAQAERIPFVIVIQHELVAAESAITLVERQGKAGFSVIEPSDLRGFHPIEAVTLPAGSTYLLVDVDTGSATRNVTPNEALKLLQTEQRTPLTIDEGIALITHYPEAVRKNHGFSLLGSRCGDRRVTALWISENRPKLGWCWAGNPHSWLGSASAAARIGA